MLKHAELTFVEVISVALNGSIRCAGVHLKIGRVLDHEHITRACSDMARQSPLSKEAMENLPNTVDNTIQLQSPDSSST